MPGFATVNADGRPGSSSSVLDRVELGRLLSRLFAPFLGVGGDFSLQEAAGAFTRRRAGFDRRPLRGGLLRVSLHRPRRSSAGGKASPSLVRPRGLLLGDGVHVRGVAGGGSQHLALAFPGSPARPDLGSDRRGLWGLRPSQVFPPWLLAQFGGGVCAYPGADQLPRSWTSTSSQPPFSAAGGKSPLGGRRQRVDRWMARRRVPRCSNGASSLPVSGGAGGHWRPLPALPGIRGSRVFHSLDSGGQCLPDTPRHRRGDAALPGPARKRKFGAAAKGQPERAFLAPILKYPASKRG